MRNFIKIKLIELLGLKNLYVEVQELRGMIEEVDYKADDCRNDLENLEYRCDEVETEADRLSSELRDELRDEFDKAYSDLQDHINNFNDMVEGYTITVKLNKE